jgi:hypothetical protein
MIDMVALVYTFFYSLYINISMDPFDVLLHVDFLVLA